MIALLVKRNDVADIAWGLGFGIVTIANLVKTQNYTFTALLVTSLILIWGLRLGWHITMRNIKKSEDYRYKAWRDSWGKWFIVRSYLQVFILQGFFMLLIVLPVLLVMGYSRNGIFSLTVLGATLWVIGFFTEAVGDKQLKEFTTNLKNKGRIMDKGFWKYSRHPNYFGEVTQWWAIGIIALTSSYGWVGLVGPMTITFLIVKVSGIPLLENKYKNNPEYQAYKLRTSMLIPLPLKKSKT